MILVATIAATPGILAWNESRKNGRKTDKLEGKVDDYHKDVNGKVAQLISASREVNVAEGRAAGVAEERSRKDKPQRKNVAKA